MELTEQQFEQLKVKLAAAKNLDDLMGKEGAIKVFLGHAIEQLVQAEMTEHLGYEKHSPQGRNTGNSRNGTTPKRLSTNVGTIEVALPRDRDGTFEPATVRKHERRLGRLEDTVMFMYSKGMSTRDIQEHFEEAYGAELSPSAITHITNSVMAQAVEWQNRELDSTYPIVFFDAVFLKVRQESKVVSKAAYTCLAIRCDGTKELLGIWLGDSESSAFWAGVMTELRNRGVRDILIACVDGIKGFSEAMGELYPMTKIQRCIIHQVRNSFRLVTWKDQKAVAATMKAIYTAPTREAAEVALDTLEADWGKKYPSLITSWRTAWPDLSTFLDYPKELRKVMYTTNAVENYHRQVRKVTKNKSAFPSDESARKLMYLNHLQLSKKWNVAIPNWPIIYSQLHLGFRERLPKLENLA